MNASLALKIQKSKDLIFFLRLDNFWNLDVFWSFVPTLSFELNIINLIATKSTLTITFGFVITTNPDSTLSKLWYRFSIF